MLNIWNHLHPKAPEVSSDRADDFYPADDLWLKVAEAAPEKSTGTLGFSQDVIEHFLETGDSSDNE